MKNRIIPFGYQIQNGTAIVHPQEIAILKRIFNCYLHGLSLLKIAEKLNDEQIEYMPGVSGWNKARLKRIIEDERYLGNEIYPAAIDIETYEKIQELKTAKNTQKQTDRTADIFQIGLPVICESCGSEMRRRHDSRNKCQQKWTCTNDDCHSIISITDEDFLQGITECLNTVIANSDMIQESNMAGAEPNNEVRRLNYEITKTLDGFGFDKEALRKKMIECVSLKYKGIDSTSHIIKRLKADFEKSSLLSIFSADLCSRTVESVRLGGAVSITLINGQQIGRENSNDTDSNCTATESGANDSCNH